MSKVDNFRANLTRLVSKPHGRKKEVAVAAGISPQYMSMILTGSSEPGFAIAIRICEVLGQSLDSMLMLPSDFAKLDKQQFATVKRSVSTRTAKPRLQPK